MSNNLPENGVLLIAHGSMSYVMESAVLAYSIQLNSPDIHITLVTDQDVAGLDTLFGHVVDYDFSGKPGVSCKLWMDEMSPYRGTTLFLDSDSLAFQNVENLFRMEPDKRFMVMGMQVPRAKNWFLDPEGMRQRFDTESFPFFIGDLYRFDRSEQSNRMFEHARAFRENYHNWSIRPLNGGMNEEPLFSLAMLKEGVNPVPRDPNHICALEHHPNFQIENLSVAERRCQLNVDGEEVNPMVLHFGSYRNQYPYCREWLQVIRLISGKTSYGALTAACFGRIRSLYLRSRRYFEKRFQGFCSEKFQLDLLGK